jgi:hypothetical protein
MSIFTYGQSFGHEGTKLKKALKKAIPMKIFPYHVNDIEFAKAIVEEFKNMEV